MNNMRYFWSSLENVTCIHFNWNLHFIFLFTYSQMVLTTQNIAETFKAFGESIVLRQFVFERQIMYKSKESYFWAHVRNL